MEYSSGKRRYFVHCETAGAIFPPLFDSAVKAHETYREVDVRGLSKMRGHDSHVEVVKFALISGWQFDEGASWPLNAYGLATRDAFLDPLWMRPDCRFQLVDGVVHIAQEVDGGFDGYYDVPICAPESQYNPNAEALVYIDGFGRELNLCPHCVAKLIG
ncbi:hypothetical protein GO285_01416 [Ralstonia solanacearum]|nr:hypothetical protein [Ralstonia solanacearum]NKG09651.1 hypothetical protein [Ralstonia solanacearum]